MGRATVEAQALRLALRLLLLRESLAKLADLGGAKVHGSRHGGGGDGSTVGGRPGSGGRGRGSLVSRAGGSALGEDLVGIMGKGEGAGRVVVKAVVGIQHAGTQLRAETVDKVSGHHAVPGHAGEVHIQLHHAEFEVGHVFHQGGTVDKAAQALLHIHLVIGRLKLAQDSSAELLPGGGRHVATAQQIPPVSSLALQTGRSEHDALRVVGVALNTVVSLAFLQEIPRLQGHLAAGPVPVKGSGVGGFKELEEEAEVLMRLGGGGI